MAIVRGGDHLLAVGMGLGGTLKLWHAENGRLLYEDCGYAVAADRGAAVSQAASTWSGGVEDGTLSVEIRAGFQALPGIRFDPWRFVGFRGFTLTVGRFPRVARWLKELLVRTLIRKRNDYPCVLARRIRFAPDGTLSIIDRIEGRDAGKARAVARQVPFHMGSTRYADAVDAFGAALPCPAAVASHPSTAERVLTIDAEGRSSGA